MPATRSPDDLRAVAREVEDFVSSAGWDQAPQLFALVPTAELLAKQPDLAGSLDQAAAITPVAQEALPDADLADTLAGIMWPDAVNGCALAQEIVVLPPDAEAALPTGGADELRRAAASVSQCGYNTALEVVRAGLPALVVPYATPEEDEQLRRARRLERLGALRVLDPERLDAETLAVAVESLLSFDPLPPAIDLDGARRTADLLWQMAPVVA
jgi:hypothetical protein